MASSFESFQVISKLAVAMENPFHTRVGTMVRNISNKFNEYEAVVEEHLTKTQTRVKDKLTNNKKSPNGEFISRGAFGKVYKGTYNGQLVAVKTMSDVDTFAKEVKMACTMSHPNIVQFIGYMDGGDLRGLLDKYEEENRRTASTLPRSRSRCTLLMLWPIYTLAPKNILLNEALGAKLTDFGVSRERVDRTMTADVGTSLWMAPEVMMGNAYDEKADVFSFGVVLSELSMHSMPYSHTKRPGSSGSCPHWLFSNESRAEC
ncbi:Protein kinase-like domain [Phytophthora cactorum]|nr:Protein kinase-like domain [Phytophthora cactorum]